MQEWAEMLEFCFFFQNVLTVTWRNGIIFQDIVILIEVRCSSVFFDKVVQPSERKGCIAEVVEECPGFQSWLGREDLLGCHKHFVKRYRWRFGSHF